MRGFRFIWAVGFMAAAFCDGYALATDLQPTADSATIGSEQDYRSFPKLDTAPREVMQGVLGNAKSNRAKPRRARPAPRKSSRPKTVTQRTRQVGKAAQRRSAQRLQKARARSKQRVKRPPVSSRPKARSTLKRPPLVQAHKPKPSLKARPSGDRAPASAKPKKSNPSKE